jgi:simple sugar transport system ATP-binding protein
LFIELDKINKFFGDYKALDNVSMYFRSGEIVGILGENGAGKTTLLNIVYGLYRPDSGIISIDGERLRYITPRYSVNKGIFLVQQFPRLIETMTGLENLVLLLNERREDVRKLLDEYSDRFKIYVDYNKKVSDMTLIERQKLYTLMSLIQNAKMILLDEPNTLLTNDLEYIDFLRRFSREHEGGVVICSHKIKAVLDISDRIYIMRRGRVLKEYKSVSKEYYDEILDIMFGHNSDTSTVYKSVEKSNRDKEISRVFSKDLFKTKDLVVRDDIGAIDLSVKRGEIVSIVTIAGRGDKELFNVLAGLTRPLKGSIIYDERTSLKNLPTREYLEESSIYLIIDWRL